MSKKAKKYCKISFPRLGRGIRPCIPTDVRSRLPLATQVGGIITPTGYIGGIITPTGYIGGIITPTGYIGYIGTHRL